ncbi:unnamed protein product [Urochloa humidicola]
MPCPRPRSTRSRAAAGSCPRSRPWSRTCTARPHGGRGHTPPHDRRRASRGRFPNGGRPRPATSSPIEPLGAAADRISGATARLDDGYVRSLVDYLDEVVGDGAGLCKGEWVMPETDLWVIRWQSRCRGLPIYDDADFGWGRPAFMCRACLQFISAASCVEFN